MTQTADLIHKMAEFFKSEEFFEKGEDARLELSPDDVRCMNEIIKACGNGVSKKVVLDMLEDINAETEGVGFYYEHYVDYIKALPSVKPQPKMGHWILQPSNKEQDERDFIWWKCSECGQVIYSETEKDRREYHAFCGRCGANMSENPTGSKPEISSYYGLKSYVRERSDKE